MKLTLFNFKRPRNTRYNYTPRFYKGKEDENPYDFDSKMVKYKEAKNTADFGSHWQDERLKKRNRKNRGINRRLIYILLILVFICLWILDFDLSIFTIPFDPFR